MKIGYARVSTDDQNPDLQFDALKEAGCERIYSDEVTGAAFKRKGLSKALRAVKPGDELIVWKLDRLGRSMREIVNIIADLVDAEVRFRSLIEPYLDPTTAMGLGVIGLVAAVAQDERNGLIERTKAGIAAARRRGKDLGRPQKMSPEKIAQARAMLPDHTRGAIAKKLEVNVGTLRRALRDERGELP